MPRAPRFRTVAVLPLPQPVADLANTLMTYRTTYPSARITGAEHDGKPAFAVEVPNDAAPPAPPTPPITYPPGVRSASAEHAAAALDR